MFEDQGTLDRFLCDALEMPGGGVEGYPPMRAPAGPASMRSRPPQLEGIQGTADVAHRFWPVLQDLLRGLTTHQIEASAAERVKLQLQLVLANRRQDFAARGFLASLPEPPPDEDKVAATTPVAGSPAVA
jgi:hypothetical protein